MKRILIIWGIIRLAPITQVNKHHSLGTVSPATPSSASLRLTYLEFCVVKTPVLKAVLLPTHVDIYILSFIVYQCTIYHFLFLTIFQTLSAFFDLPPSLNVKCLKWVHAATCGCSSFIGEAPCYSIVWRHQNTGIPFTPYRSSCLHGFFSFNRSMSSFIVRLLEPHFSKVYS